MKYLCISILLIIFFLGNAQQYQISGSVLKVNKEPLEYVTISVYPKNDSLAVVGTITDDKGYFLLNKLEPTNYQCIIQMIGYKDSKINFNLTENIELQPIILEESTEELDEVIVIAETSALEQKLGKKVLNIGRDLSTSSSNALEALDRIPSVTTTQRGAIQIRGNSGVVIYVNGKRTNRNPKTLKYISAASLSKIEVITNPSAKEDAEGIAGIINLVYKKEKTKKLKLETNTTIGFPEYYSIGVNANLNTERTSLYTNISTFKRWFNSADDIKRLDITNDELTNESALSAEGTFTNNNVLLGYSVEIDSTFSTSLEVNYGHWKSKNKTLRTTTFFSNTNDIYNFENNSSEIEGEISAVLNVNKAFTPNHKLSFSLNIGGENETVKDNNHPKNNLYNSNESYFLKASSTDEQQRYYQSQLDFELPFFKFGILELGARYDVTNYDVLQKIQLQPNIDIPNNDFIMEMQKFGAYALQKKKFTSFEYEIGLRMELFNSNALQRSNQEKFKQRYQRFFPSGQLLYIINNHKHTIGISYTKRIKSPSFWDLNPYVSYESPLNLRKGNPALEPEIADLYEVTYHKDFNTLSLDLTLYNTITNNTIQPTVNSIDNNQTMQTYINFDKRTNKGIEALLEYRITEKLKSTATFTYSSIGYKDLENSLVFNNVNTWSLLFRQYITLPKNFKIEAAYTYRAPTFGPQSKRLEYTYLNLFITKKLNKNRGTLVLGLRDIFNTREYKSVVFGNDYRVNSNSKWQSQQLSLSFRYQLFK